METGFFPLMSLLLGGALYGLYWWVLRLRVGSRWSQAFIAVAMALMVAVQLAAPVREVEMPEPVLPAPFEPGATAMQELPQKGGAEAVPAQPLEVLETAVQTPTAQVQQGPAEAASPMQLLQNAMPLLGRLWLLGMVAVLAYFACQLAWLCSLCRKYGSERRDGVNIYRTEQLAPFSFGRNIFLLSSLDADTVRYVLLHEHAHIRHRHFLKLCLLQLLVALCWYNPFAWLFFGEMRLQQEMEVDGDVLRQGVDRQDYQLSLLRACVSQGKWILLRTAYGMKPLKQRIIFMNTEMNKRNVHRRQLAALAALTLVLAVTMAVGCQTRERDNTPTDNVRHHPMRGCWTMDWISNTGSGEEVHPFAMHYGFYNDSTFLCFSYLSKRGMNMRFSISGEGYTWHGDTLCSADGRPTDNTFPDEHTVISRWMKDSTQMAGVSGPDITEQWSRIEPDADIVAAFRAALTAQRNGLRPLDGTWLTVGDAKGTPEYMLVNDSVAVMLSMHPSTVVEGFRYGGYGYFNILEPTENGGLRLGAMGLTIDVEHTDADHITVNCTDAGGDSFQVNYRRIETPAYLRRAFAPALTTTD